jgi:hypothetical protein
MKPILIIKFPSHIGMEELQRVHHHTEAYIGEDYYVFTFPVSGTNIEFELLNAINATETDIKDIKALIADALDKTPFRGGINPNKAL